jgi:hypothetical protein
MVFFWAKSITQLQERFTELTHFQILAVISIFTILSDISAFSCHKKERIVYRGQSSIAHFRYFATNDSIFAAFSIHLSCTKLSSVFV